MKLFIWWADRPHGIIVTADDLTHAYGLMTTSGKVDKDSRAFTSAPDVATDTFPDTVTSEVTIV